MRKGAGRKRISTMKRGSTSRLDPIGERSKQAVKKDSASFRMEVKMENSIYIYI